MNNIEFNYQRIISDDCVPIGNEVVSYFPLLIDYSSSYKYNQYNVVSSTKYTVKSDPLLYLDDVDNDNIVITNKETTLGVPLFYQYQLKFDATNIQNLKIYDEDNKLVSPSIEYGDIYLGDMRTPFLLKKNKAKYIDTLNDRTELGVASKSLYYKFLSNLMDGTEDNLSYRNYDMCLANGTIDYESNLLSEEGQLEVYFMAKECTHIITEVLYFKGGEIKVNFDYTNPDYTLKFVVNDAIQGTFAVTQGKWYKLYIVWSKDGENSEIKMKVLGESGFVTVTGDDSYTCNEAFIDLFTSSDFHIRSNDNYLYNLAIFDGVVEDDWIDPIYSYRYMNSVVWHSTTLGDAPYRVRLLFPDDKKYTVIYDAIDKDGDIILNKREIVNCELVYNKYSDVEVNDWYYSSGKVYLTEVLLNDVSVDDELWVVPIVEKQMKVVLDDNINIVNGIFRSDNYGGANEDFFYLPEYSEMPVISDNQISEEILCWKVVRERVKIIDQYKFQINEFLFYEGLYPGYVIPNTFEEHKHVESIAPPSGVVSDTVDVSINYANTRGMNIYINNELINNSDIINYSPTGVIELSRRLKLDDNVEVSYLKRADSYIAQYPKLSKDIIGDNKYRLYLRPSFPNYATLWPSDSAERLVYKVMSDGVPTGDYRSCLTNNVINTAYEPANFSDRYIKLADITMISTVKYSDVRRRGGGIKEDADLGGITKRLTKFPLSPGYMDIGLINGEQLPNSIVFYRIPKNLKEQLDAKFDTPEKAMYYIKKEIEKHIAIGVFYLVVTEENEIYPNGYPSGINIGVKT